MNRKIDDMICLVFLSCKYFFMFFTISFLRVLIQIKLILRYGRLFENTYQDNPITEDPKEDFITKHHKESTFPEDPKENLSLRIIKRIPSLRTSNRFLPLEPSGGSGPLMSFASQDKLFLIFCWWYAVEWDKYSCNNFGLGRPSFHTTVVTNWSWRILLINVNATKGLIKSLIVTYLFL